MPRSGPASTRFRLVALLVLLLGACGAGPGGETGGQLVYPRLRDVPARPVLVDTPETRRDLANELLVDRTDARYARERAMFLAGEKAALPPPQPAPELPALPPVAGPRADPNPTATYVEDRVRTENIDGSMSDFLERLVRFQPDPNGPYGLSDTGPIEPQRNARSPLDEETSPADALGSFFSVFGGALGDADSAPSSAATSGGTRAASTTALPDALLVPFENDDDEPQSIPSELDSLVVEARRRGATVRVVGHGGSATIAVRRARAVAARLVAAGLPESQIAIEIGAPGSVVEVGLSAPAAS